MSKNNGDVPFSVLTQVHEIYKRIANGTLSESSVRDALQALIEGRPSGQSSRDGRIVTEFEGYSFTEANFAERIIYKGRVLKRHRNGGGWVPVDQSAEDVTKPFVAETAYFGPNARIFDSARIYGKAQVSGEAHISCDARIYGKARVSGEAWVYDDARVSGSAEVSGRAMISLRAHVSGNARVQGISCVSGDTRVRTGLYIK